MLKYRAVITAEGLPLRQYFASTREACESWADLVFYPRDLNFQRPRMSDEQKRTAVCSIFESTEREIARLTPTVIGAPAKVVEAINRGVLEIRCTCGIHTSCPLHPAGAAA